MKNLFSPFQYQLFSARYCLVKKTVRLVVLFALSLCYFPLIYAQYQPNKINKKAIAIYDLAMEKIGEEDFIGAEKLLKQAIQTAPGYLEAFLSLSGVYGHQKKYAPAVEAFQKAQSIDSSFVREYQLSHAINLSGLGKFEEAQKVINDFLKILNLNETSQKAALYRKRNIDFALEFEKNNPNRKPIVPENMGPAINTSEPEYFPSLTAERNQLVFTRRLNHFNEDFYESFKADTGWQKAKGLLGDINTNFNEGAQNISQDGQLLVFTGCNFENGMGSCDIYFSIKTKQGWSKAENIGRNINSEFWESQPSLSPDKNTLYFASNRAGGYGGVDLYRSKRKPGGAWGEPENLGPAINTKGDESCPFLHADGETLYFMSSGHQGYGGDDLFYARPDSNGIYQNPINLGYPINTIEHEGSLFISTDGKTAFYASDRGEGFGSLDIYQFELPESTRPTPTTWIKGQVFHAKNKSGLPSLVEIIDLNTNTRLHQLQTDEDGHFLATIPAGKNYSFSVNRTGFLFYSENFIVPNQSANEPYERNIPLQPIETGATITLKNVLFETGSFALQRPSRTELDKLIQILQENPTVSIEISGHTDNQGNAAANLELSKKRAAVIVQYLSEKGISSKRLRSVGYGDTQPIASNENEEGRALNRRTEIKVISVNLP